MTVKTAFHQEVAKFQPGTRYVGAMSGELEPGAIAAEVFGETLSHAALMTYCFRRFGPPTMPSDDYKEVARWALTTPLPDLFLGVAIIATDRPDLLFGYLATRDLGERIFTEAAVRRQAVQDDFRAWLKEVRGIDPDAARPDVLSSARDEEKEARWRALWDEFDMSGARDNIDVDTPTTDAANAALRIALESLLQVVVVWDSHINATGVISDDDVDGLAGCDPFRHAGVPVPDLMLSDPESLLKLARQAESLGTERAIGLLQGARR